MKRKRKKLTPEERAEIEERGRRVERMLRERIAYHEAKIAEEERAAKGGAGR